MAAIGSPNALADVVDRPWRVLHDVVQESDELRVLVVARAAQHVGHRLRVRQALARAHGDAVVGVEDIGDRVGAYGGG